MSLTTVQNEILKFIKTQVDRQGVAPSTSDICAAFGFKSFGTVARHMKRLEEKGYLKRAGRRNKQGIVLKEQVQSVAVPLFGSVAAGVPIEAIEGQGEFLQVPPTMLRGGEHFALRVRGSSMIEDGMFDGDYIVVKKQNHANEGETVVALLGNEATVKRFYRKSGRIELRPANAAMESIWVSPEARDPFQIQGVVVGLFRQYS